MPVTHPLGSTSHMVTRMGLGLAALGRPGYINLGHADDLGGDYRVDVLQKRADQILDVAYERGIRYFDAARSYGRAEAFLGTWLDSRGHSPDDVCIGSKWGYTYTAQWQVTAEKHEVKEHSLRVLDRQWAQSRERLGAFLDLYQIHSATFESGVLEHAPVLNRLAELKQEGIAIGLTVSGARQAEIIRRSLEIVVDGVPLFDSVQATWNILERSAGPVLVEAHQRGVGVMIKEALANGRLTLRNTSPDFQARLNVLKREAGRLSGTVDALALAAVLAQPWVDVVLSGAAVVDHLTSNLEAFSIAWDSEAEAALEPLMENAERYWTIRSELAWN